MGVLLSGFRALTLVLPMAGTGVIAVAGRTPDSFPNPELGPVLGQKIEAYVGPVRASQCNIMVTKTFASDDAVERTARVWMTAFRTGSLKPLPSVGAGDTTRDGVKGQILVARNVVIANLIRIGDDASLAGRTEIAKHRYQMALEISKVARESDLNALAASMSYENAAWSRLSRLGLQGPPPDHGDRARLDHLLNREFFQLYRQPSHSESERSRMKQLFERARQRDGSFADLLSTGDYELSLMLAAARRIESLIALRSRLSQNLLASQ